MQSVFHSRCATEPAVCGNPTRMPAATLPRVIDSVMSQAPAAVAASSPATAGPGVGASGMWTFLATDVMGFGGLFIAYAWYRVRAESWPDPRERLALAPAAAMTFVLLASSLTMTLATRATNRQQRLLWLGATLALGVAFLVGAAAEYAHLPAFRGWGFRPVSTRRPSTR